MDKQNLFTSGGQPAISPTGTLTFAPATSVDGSATVTVTAMDDGGKANGGDDTSAPQTFTITIVGQPEIAVSGNGMDIPDGDSAPSTGNHTDFGEVGIASGMVTRAYTVANSGPGSLTLGNVTVSGDHASDFTVSQQPMSSVAADASATFTVKFDPSATGSRTATLSIANDDTDENPFTFVIQGTGFMLNTAPTLDVIADVNLLIDAPAMTVRLTGISDGDGGSQTLMVTASSSNTDLIPDLTVNYTSPNATGTLQSMPVAGMTGSATITVTVMDNGPSGDGQVNTFSRSFAVSVTDMLNQPPSFMLSRSWTAREMGRKWRCVASSADGTKLVAGVNDGKIYTSTDSGVSWTAQVSGTKWRAVASSADGTKLVAGVYGGQIYTSADLGMLGMLWTPSESNRRWYSVASSADGTKLVAVAVDGQIYTSTNSGASWTARESRRNWNSVASSADGTKLVAAVIQTVGARGLEGGKIYTSIDSGASWTARESKREWISVASSADGTKLVAAAISRDRTTFMEGDYFGHIFGHIYTSADSGASWMEQTDAGARLWQSVASSADGTKLVAVDGGGHIYTADLSFNQTIADGAGPRTVPKLAQNISPGPDSESGQTVTFMVSNDKNGLFDAQPAISSDGTLTYTPKQGQSGTATVMVTLKDDGGTASGGSDTSAAQTFTITVFPSVNVSNDDSMPRTLNNQQLANTRGSPVTLSGATTLSGSVGVARGSVTLSGAVTVNNGATLNVAGASAVTITGPLMATPADSPLVKTGPGKLIIDGANFNGTITVLEGTVVIKNSNEDTCLELGGKAVAMGDGMVDCVISKAGSTISPGESPGAVTVMTDADWEAGSIYAWEINDAAGMAGGDPGWDMIAIGGKLTLSGGTGRRPDIEDQPINIVLTTLTAGNEAGSMANFNNAAAYSWTIASAAGGITGFDPATINLDSSGIANDLGGGAFAISAQNGTDLVLSFIPAAQHAAPTDIGLSASSVAEASNFGATIGLLTATDSNAADNHTFTLVEGAGDTDNASFQIAGAALQTAAVFDYETKSSFRVRVRATDAGGLFVEKQFTITVTDVVESAMFQPGQFAFVDGLIQIKLEGVPNMLWRIDASSDLKTWSTVGTYSLPLDGVLNFVDPDSAGQSRRYYRAVLMTP